MKVGQDLAQQLNSLSDEQLQENANALLDGLKSSVVSVLLSSLLERLKTYIQDPAVQQKIIQWALDMLKNLFNKP